MLVWVCLWIGFSPFFVVVVLLLSNNFILYREFAVTVTTDFSVVVLGVWYQW